VRGATGSSRSRLALLDPCDRLAGVRPRPGLGATANIEPRGFRIYSEPERERPPPGAALRSRLRRLLRARRHRRGVDHRSPLGAPGRRPGSRPRGCNLGLPRRDHRRPRLLPPDELGSGAAHVVGAVRRLEGRPRHLGRDRCRHGDRHLGAPPTPRRHPSLSRLRQRLGSSSPRRSGASGTTSTRSCLAGPRRCRGRCTSILRTGPTATRTTRPFTRPSSTSCSGISHSRASSSCSDARTGFGRRGSSRSMWPATRASGSSRRRCASTLRTICSVCG
jgi:hypothetical protein